MPSDTWPVDTPVPAMLDRVRGRAQERRRRRRTRQGVVGVGLTAAVLVGAVSLSSMPTASRLRTTPAERSDGTGNESNADGSSTQAAGGDQGTGDRSQTRRGSGGGGVASGGDAPGPVSQG
ncbi:MAG: hypothetical protein M3394_10275, partial [Actinomycetota bacterium]|nr:hypothetical protein [Actinomycetota bacterium]